MCKGCALCKVKPKDAVSNLSYMFAHVVYRIVTTAIIAKADDPMLFDANELMIKSHLAQKHPQQWRVSRAEDNRLIRRR